MFSHCQFGSAIVCVPVYHNATVPQCHSEHVYVHTKMIDTHIANMEM